MIFNLQFYENHKSDQLERYSNASQNSSEIWCEFRVCRVKALGGDRIANLVSEE